MLKRLSALFAASAFILASASFGATKTYQVTGPVREVNGDSIVVQKGKDRWEISKDAATKVSGGEIKKGDKVTIEYRMAATEVEVKGAKKK